MFLATALKNSDQKLVGCLTCGPFIVGNNEDTVYIIDSHDSDDLKAIPKLSTEKIRSFSEIIRASSDYITNNITTKPVDSGKHAGMLSLMYDITESKKSTYPIELEHELTRLIAAGDKEGSLEILNQLLCHMYFCNNADFDAIKPRVIELIVLLSRATIDSGADIEEIFWLNNNYIKEVQSFENLEHLSIWLSGIVHKFISYVFDFTAVKHRDVIYKSIDYIKNNYTEKLTLEQLADHVYLSKSYLSKILRDELGCSFVEYLNKVRIEKSKTYLKNNTLSLVDIAYLIGFDDQSYFSKVFKKVTGISPGKYREQGGKIR